jgi:hypothetical protein
LKSEEEIKELTDDNKALNKDKNFYNDELKKINAFSDPSGLTVDQI